MTHIVHFSGFNGGNRKVLSPAISYTVQHAALVPFSARSRNVTFIAAHFFGLQSEIVNFGYSLSRTLFGTQPECD